MTDAEEVEFWTSVEAELAEDDGEAVREHLAAGRPVPYLDPDTPPGHVMRRYPDGRRELVRVDEHASTVVAVLPAD